MAPSTTAMRPIHQIRQIADDSRGFNHCTDTSDSPLRRETICLLSRTWPTGPDCLSPARLGSPANDPVGPLRGCPARCRTFVRFATPRLCRRVTTRAVYE